MTDLDQIGVVVSFGGHHVHCIGNPAQQEAFEVSFMDANDNDAMIGRKDGHRHFMNWADVIQRAAAQAREGSEIIQIRVKT